MPASDDIEPHLAWAEAAVPIKPRAGAICGETHLRIQVKGERR